MSRVNFLVSLKQDIANLLGGKSEINVDVFINPTKYTIRLPVKKIVADNKVSKQGIQVYKQKITNKEKTTPIIVVKHPVQDLYAVLDGHHRYYAYLELGKKEIDCALAGDYSTVIFYLTEHGYFQPSPEWTEEVRQPAIKLRQNLNKFLTDFVNNMREESS